MNVCLNCVKRIVCRSSAFELLNYSVKLFWADYYACEEKKQKRKVLKTFVYIKVKKGKNQKEKKSSQKNLTIPRKYSVPRNKSGNFFGKQQKTTERKILQLPIV